MPGNLAGDELGGGEEPPATQVVAPSPFASGDEEGPKKPAEAVDLRSEKLPRLCCCWWAFLLVWVERRMPCGRCWALVFWQQGGGSLEDGRDA